MGFGDFADKAKNLAGEHADKISEQADKVIDSKLDGDAADKAKDAVKQGLDKLGGEK